MLRVAVRDVLTCNVTVGGPSAPISEDNGSNANLIADESLEYIVNASLEGKWKMETRKEVRCQHSHLHSSKCISLC